MIVPPLSSILSYSNRPPPLPSKWWQASDYLLDGYAPYLAADFVRDRYSLMGRAVPAEALFSRQGGPKWVMGPDGRLKEVPANTLAFDYSSGRRRLLLEGASTNLCQYSDNMMTYSWSPEKIEHEDGWVELVKRAGGDVYMSVASIANPGSGTYAFRVSLRSGLSTTCAVGLYTGNWGNAADLIDPIIEGPGVIAPVAGSSLFIVSGLTDEETVVTISRKVLDSDHSLGAFIYPGNTMSSVPENVTYSNLIRRPQLEPGPIATSYIPTNGAAVTRVADVAPWSDGAVGAVNNVASTLAFRAEASRRLSLGPLLQIGTGTRGVVGMDSAGNIYQSRPNGQDSLISAYSSTLGSCHGWDDTAISASLNGSAVRSRESAVTGEINGANMQGAKYAKQSIDEIIIWPIKGSDAAIQNQARAWS